MDDRSPVKLLLCARDVLTGIVQPWNLGEDHNSMLGAMRDRIDETVESRPNDTVIVPLLIECIELVKKLCNDATGVNRVWLRFDRARRTLECVLNEARRMTEDKA